MIIGNKCYLWPYAERNFTSEQNAASLLPMNTTIPNLTTMSKTRFIVLLAITLLLVIRAITVVTSPIEDLLLDKIPMSLGALGFVVLTFQAYLKYRDSKKEKEKENKNG